MTVDSRSRAVGGLVVAGLAGLPALGGMMLGLSIPAGQFCAIGLLCVGVSIAGILWWASRAYAGDVFDQVNRLSFAGTGGLAVYGTAAWLFWRAGLPIDLGVIRDGRMAEFWWLGPATGAYSACCFAVMRWNTARASTRKRRGAVDPR